MSAALDGGDLAPGGQKPRALRPGDLVRGKRQQVPGKIEGNPSRRLNCVDVQGNAMFAAEGSDFPDGEDHAGLVVHGHRRAERGARQRPAQRLQVQLPRREHRHPHGLANRLAGGEHSRVLDRRGHHFARAGPEDGEGVRFGAPRGEDHLARRAAQRPRAALAGGVDEGASVLPGLVHRRRICEELRQGRHHLRHHFARQRGGRVRVQIDGCRSHGSSGTKGVPGPGRRWNARKNVAEMSFASDSGERPRSGIRAPAIAP